MNYTTTDSTGGWDGNTVVYLPHPTFTITYPPYSPPTYTPLEEKPMTAIPDSLAEEDVLDPLELMRAARHAAQRKMQALNDRAVLHDIEASRLRAQSKLVWKEVNEDVPIPSDD